MHYTYTMYTTNADDAGVAGDDRVLWCPINCTGAMGGGRPTWWLDVGVRGWLLHNDTPTLGSECAL